MSRGPAARCWRAAARRFWRPSSRRSRHRSTPGRTSSRSRSRRQKTPEGSARRKSRLSAGEGPAATATRRGTVPMAAHAAAPPSAAQPVHPVDEVLPPGKLAVYGVQHVLAFYAGAVIVPILLAGAIGLEG